MSKRTLTVIIGVLIAAIVIIGFLYIQEITTSTPDAENDRILTAVSQHILLPQGTPVVATIQDVEQLAQEQDFFAQAQNGDYLIIYAESRKAIIYREEADLLVNVGPTTLSDESTAEESEKKNKK